MPKPSAFETAPPVRDVGTDETIQKTCFDKFRRCGMAKLQDFVLSCDFLIISPCANVPQCHHALAFQAFEQISFRLIHQIALRYHRVRAIETIVTVVSRSAMRVWASRLVACWLVSITTRPSLVLSLLASNDFPRMPPRN